MTLVGRFGDDGVCRLRKPFSRAVRYTAEADGEYSLCHLRDRDGSYLATIERDGRRRDSLVFNVYKGTVRAGTMAASRRSTEGKYVPPAVSILVGQRLGAGDREGAIDINNKLIFFTLVSHVAIGLLLVAAAPFIPLLYRVEPEVRTLASRFLTIAGAAAPIHAFIHVIYFAIRSGGKTFVTFLFDSVYTWVVPATLSFILCRFTELDIAAVYFAVQFIDVVKLLIGVPLLRSGFWANRIVDAEGTEEEAAS